MRWSRTFKISLLSLILGWLLAGCTLTPPSSEALIFKGKKPDTALGPLFPQPTYRPPEQVMKREPFKILFSTTARPQVDGELQYAKDKFALFIRETLDDSTLTEDDLIIRNPYYLSLGVPITLLNRQKVRWALNVGVPVLGMDVTTNLAPRTYLTANLGFGDGEVIVQQKVVRAKAIGLALGGYYRAERRGFEIEGDELSLVIFEPIADALSADRIFYNHIIGGRINGYVPINSNSYLHLRAAPGYAVNLKKPIINFGLTVRFDFSQ